MNRPCSVQARPGEIVAVVGDSRVEVDVAASAPSVCRAAGAGTTCGAGSVTGAESIASPKTERTRATSPAVSGRSPPTGQRSAISAPHRVVVRAGHAGRLDLQRRAEPCRRRRSVSVISLVRAGDQRRADAEHHDVAARPARRRLRLAGLHLDGVDRGIIAPPAVSCISALLGAVDRHRGQASPARCAVVAHA